MPKAIISGVEFEASDDTLIEYCVDSHKVTFRSLTLGKSAQDRQLDEYKSVDKGRGNGRDDTPQAEDLASSSKKRGRPMKLPALGKTSSPKSSDQPKQWLPGERKIFESEIDSTRVKILDFVKDRGEQVVEMTIRQQVFGHGRSKKFINELKLLLLQMSEQGQLARYASSDGRHVRYEKPQQN